MAKSKQSAGILLYRQRVKGLEVLLVHPGGPFFARRDNGVWSLPKGEYGDGEDALEAAKREYQEEIGSPPPDGEPLDLGTVKNKSGKVIYGFALEGDFDVADLSSNTFELEWPPKSGHIESFPEADKARWLNPEQAKQKISVAQAEFIDRLLGELGLEPPVAPLEQPSLF